MAKRPAQIPRRPPLTRLQIDQTKYVGSREHKDRRWWGGQPEAWVNERGVAMRPGRQLTAPPKVDAFVEFCASLGR
jgi:hypothetical protein